MKEGRGAGISVREARLGGLGVRRREDVLSCTRLARGWGQEWVRGRAFVR